MVPWLSGKSSCLTSRQSVVRVHPGLLDWLIQPCWNLFPASKFTIDFGHLSHKNEQTYTFTKRRATASTYRPAARTAPLPLKIQTHKSHWLRRWTKCEFSQYPLRPSAEPMPFKNVWRGEPAQLCRRIMSRQKDARRRRVDRKSQEYMKLEAIHFCRQKRVNDKKRRFASP